MYSLAQIEGAASLVYRYLPATPQYCWPLLCARTETEVWVKHENHTPIGAFKVRGGLVYLDQLERSQPAVSGVVAATRGNHGQSIAYAARALGKAAVIVVPHGNSVEKNRAMRGLAAELVEHGHDFNSAHDHAVGLAESRGLHMLRSFHPWLVLGVASYGLEFLRAVPELEAVYVPIGLGSGICGLLAARAALGLRTEVIGVVAERAPAYARSFAAGKPVATNSADTLADGVAVRVPDPDALEVILAGVARIVTVSEAEIRAAMRAYYTDTHNLAEGAGAAPLAALLQERARMAGRRVGVILSGGNVDAALFREVLAEAEA